jgi:AcrR family transcriptional regulator
MAVPIMDRTEVTLGTTASLRNEPVQARSAARLAALLDAAAAAVDQLGYERLTTAMVAERAGASIGTVYRYFPDRIAVLQALSARNLERILRSISVCVSNHDATSWSETVDAFFDAYVEDFRSEAGFAALRSGDVLDLRPATNASTANSHVAEALMTAIADRFQTDSSAETRSAFEIAFEIQDALTARAFAAASHGDPIFLDRARELLRSTLAARLG